MRTTLSYLCCTGNVGVAGTGSWFIMSGQECERCKISHQKKVRVRDRIRDHDSSILFGVLLAILRLPIGNRHRKGVLLGVGVGIRITIGE